MHISVTDPIHWAFQRTGTVLFKPFDLGKWFVLGFCAFLAYLAEGGGFQISFQTGGGPGGRGGMPGRTPGQWLLDQLYWLGPVVAVALVLGLAVLTLLLWLQSRGKFMFIAGLASNHAAVVEPWRQYSAMGNNLFRFRLLVLLIATAFALVAAAVALVIAWPDLMAGTLTAYGIGGIVLAVVTLPSLGLLYLLVALLVEDFIAPAMFAREVPVGEAWTLLRREVFAGNLGMIVLFYLMRILIGIVIAALTTVATCLTCCLAAVPYLGTVILLPLFVFQRCYSLYFLQQFGGAWQIFTTPEGAPSVCPACGYDLRGNPAATHCPECGYDLPGLPQPAPPTPPPA